MRLEQFLLQHTEKQPPEREAALLHPHNSEFVEGNIRPRSRPSEPPGKLRCVLTPSALLRAQVPQCSREVKSLPPASRLPTASFLPTFRALSALNFPSVLRHEANTRPKGHCGPSACQENSCVETTHGASFIFDFFPSQAIKVRLKRLVASFWSAFQTLPEHQSQTKKARAIV